MQLRAACAEQARCGLLKCEEFYLQGDSVVPELTNARFLIVKLSAIGDVIHGLPVLNALRSHYPNSHLSWVVEGRTAELLHDHPALDRLIVAPRRWLKSPRTVIRLRRELQQLRPEVAIDMQCLARSAIMSWLSGAETRIGFAGKDGREGSTLLNNRLITPSSTHVIERNLQLLEPLGIQNPEVTFNFPLFSEEEATIARLLQKEKLSEFAVINPGAGWPSKRWEMDRYGCVAAHLGRVHQLRTVVMWAGPEEKSWAEYIVDHADGHALQAPNTTLRELAALVRRATLFIGSDTGPMHIAAAMGTPCVALFGPVPAERNGPYGSRHIALQKLTVAGSSRKRRNAGNESMLAISVQDVCEACDTILSRERIRISA